MRPTKAALGKTNPELVNRKHIIFQWDNARWPVSLMTIQKLLELSWWVLIHWPYVPDIELSDVHLFHSLQNSLNGKKSNSLENYKRQLGQFFPQKGKKFWEDGIMKLSEKWQKIVEQNGKYTVQIKFLMKTKNVLFLFKNQRNFLANPIPLLK